jgi:NADPH:quinone reductase-like Zn-dependent oxidoreductase
VRAVVQERYGSLDELVVRDVPRPVPGRGEVLVRVRAASANPDVWHVVVGRPWVLRLMGNGIRRPGNSIPGTDMAGVVEAVGPHAERFRRGDEVFGETIRTHQWTNGGAYAELVCAREEWLAAKPSGIGFEEAASTPTSGYIALLNLRGASLSGPGCRLLVNGAAGGVGSIALQVARARGAHVTAVDHTKKLELLHSLGADEVVDYTREDFTRSGARWDLIFDVPGNHPVAECLAMLRPGGRYVLIGHDAYGASRKPLLGQLPRMIGVIFRSLSDERLRLGRDNVPSRDEAMSMLGGFLESGALTPTIDSTYPLERAGEALRHMAEDDLLGKVIVTP